MEDKKITLQAGESFITIEDKEVTIQSESVKLVDHDSKHCVAIGTAAGDILSGSGVAVGSKDKAIVTAEKDVNISSSKNNLFLTARKGKIQSAAKEHNEKEVKKITRANSTEG